MAAQPPHDRNTARRPALVESVWQLIRTRLEEERRRIQEEIKNYPRPIPACDVQFNHLLERRAVLAEELAHLHEASGGSRSDIEAEKLLEGFIGSMRYLDEEDKRKLLASLERQFKTPPEPGERT